MPEYADLMFKRFEWDGQGPDEFNCYSLVRELLRREGIDVPRRVTPADRGRIATAMMSDYLGDSIWTEVGKRPGAVALFRIKGMATHVAYVLDEYYMLHCWQGSKSVVRERIADWERRLVAYYRPKGHE